MKPSPCQSERGYTLVEILIVIVIMGVVTTAIMATFMTGDRQYGERDAAIRMQQQARLAMNDMERNIRMAGYGLMEMGNLRVNTYKYVSVDILSTWIMVEGTDGASGDPDTITFRYQNPDLPTDMPTDPFVTLTSDYPSSKPAMLPLSSSAGFQEGDLFIIYDPSAPSKPASLLQVSNIPSSGDKIDHGFNQNRFPYNPPASFELFPAGGYSEGSRIINLKNLDMRRITYSIVDGNLVRDLWTSTTGTSQRKIVATGIQDLQIRYQFADGTWDNVLSQDVLNLRGVRIGIIARTAKPDPRYQDSQMVQLTGPLGNGKPYSGGGYRRMSMSTTVFLRNLAMRPVP